MHHPSDLKGYHADAFIFLSLQEPFFNLGAPASVNFGAIGKTIGHEMIHSYDDEGKQYDENGSLRDWWTTKTEKKYTRKAECFIHQYNKYKDATTGLSVNGFNTEGENIAGGCFAC